ncbi:hypothetical protein PJL18_04238 [Paenarthrobacter nicotinovorans]|nr:hypothetical protein [Paenarthrobacter nicotinovorans]
MDSCGAVPEFRSSDVDGEPSVRLQTHPGVGEVATRRHGVDHGQRRSFPDHPFRPEVVQPCRTVAFLPPVQGIAHQRHALVKAVAPVVDVFFRLGRSGQHVIAGPDHVLEPELQGIHADAHCEFINGRLDREDHLAQPVTTESPGRNGVGVDGVGIHFLVHALVHGQRFAATVEHHAGSVVSIGAGVREDVQLQRGEVSVPVGAGLQVNREGVARSGCGELFGPRELQLDGPLQREGCKGNEVLGEHLLLAAEPATNTTGHHADGLRRQVEQTAQRPLHQERNLRGGTDHQPAIVIQPGNGGVRFHGHVLDALGLVSVFVDEIGGSETVSHAAKFSMDLGHHVLQRPGDA